MTDKEALELIKKYGYGYKELTTEWPKKELKKYLIHFKKTLEKEKEFFGGVKEMVPIITHGFEGPPIQERWKKYA